MKTSNNTCRESTLSFLGMIIADRVLCITGRIRWKRPTSLSWPAVKRRKVSLRSFPCYLFVQRKCSYPLHPLIFHSTALLKNEMFKISSSNDDLHSESLWLIYACFIIIIPALCLWFCLSVIARPRATDSHCLCDPYVLIYPAVCGSVNVVESWRSVRKLSLSSYYTSWANWSWSTKIIKTYYFSITFFYVHISQ